jgi:hypothetical protein
MCSLVGTIPDSEGGDRQIWSNGGMMVSKGTKKKLGERRLL